MTSAPSQASTWVQAGPAWLWVISTILTPFRAALMGDRSSLSSLPGPAMLAAMTQQIPDPVNGSAFAVGGWEVDILVTGFPGKSVRHGSLGWSTIVLVRRGDRLALVDCGAFGHRKLLAAALAERGLKPSDITDLLLTHTHYDHAVNWVLFPKARVAVGAVELDWAAGEPWGETVVPELYVRELGLFPKTERVADGEEVFPGISAHLAPGTRRAAWCSGWPGQSAMSCSRAMPPRTARSSSPAMWT